MARAVAGCAGIADHGGTAQAAEGFSGEQIIDGALLDMAGGFGFHALGLLPNRSLNDGGHAAGDADVSPDINAGITLVIDGPENGLRAEPFPPAGQNAFIVQVRADPGGGEAGGIQLENVADDGGLVRLDGIAPVSAAGIAEDPRPVIKAAAGIVRHAAGDVFRQLAGIPFGGGLQHALQEDTGGAFRDRLHRVKDLDAVAAELPFIDGGILPVAPEAVHLPRDDGVETAGLRGGKHGLKRRAGGGILKTGPGMIRVFMHKGETFALRKGPDIRQLLLDGDIALAGGGITGISDGGMRGTGQSSLLFHKRSSVKQTGVREKAQGVSCNVHNIPVLKSDFAEFGNAPKFAEERVENVMLVF